MWTSARSETRAVATRKDANERQKQGQQEAKRQSFNGDPQLCV